MPCVECGPACGPSRPALRRRSDDGPPWAGRRWRDLSRTGRRAMNRFRMMVVSSFAGLGLLSFGASSGRAQGPYMARMALAPAAVTYSSSYQVPASVPAPAPTPTSPVTHRRSGPIGHPLRGFTPAPTTRPAAMTTSPVRGCRRGEEGAQRPTRAGGSPILRGTSKRGRRVRCFYATGRGGMSWGRR
jgi:hypothetical protein